jgi:hypothetical protein
MLNDQQLGEKLNASPAPRVTKEQIEERIVMKDFVHITPTVTLCNITLDNGYSVRGEAACVNSANYDREIGERFAYDDAFKKLWPLFGFALAETQHQQNRTGGLQQAA